MTLGAVFEREVSIAPRSQPLYVARAVYSGVLFAIVATCWLVVTTTQPIDTVGDQARFAATLLRILAPLQAVLAVLASAMLATLSVGMEKDRRTLELLLMSDLGDRELVLGKLFGSLLQVALLLLSAIPVFAAVGLLGGVTTWQLGRLFLVTAAASLAAASLATAVAFWRDTTFQSISITLCLLVAWVGLGEFVAAVAGSPAAAACSPARAVMESLRPGSWDSLWRFLATSLLIAVMVNGRAVGRMRSWVLGERSGGDGRSWRTSGHPAQQRGVESTVIEQPPADEARRAVGAPVVDSPRSRAERIGLGNPVLWRETATAAYGRAIHLVRAAWLVIFAAAGWGVWREASSPNPDGLAMAVSVVPVALATLVAVATLGVTSITNERDRGTFDLLLVSDLTPSEIVWGKLLGILVVAREIVVLPVLAGAALAIAGIASVEHAVYLSLGMAILVGFCTMLGVHVGLSYPVSRRAIGVTLATVVFLFVGVATAMRIMVAFAASFELQLAPFLAVMVGGGIGLYAALAIRVPSAAIGWAAAILPTLTFVAITSFLQGQPLQVFLVVLVAYGFSTAAMLIPAIAAFDAITGRVD